MGNSHGHHCRGGADAVSRQSTCSDFSSGISNLPGAGMCPHKRSQSVRTPARRVHSSHSSTDSEPNNNVKSASVSSADQEVLQIASRVAAPLKQRKISRAASAGRIRNRRTIPGIGSFSTKDGMREASKDAVQQSWSVLTSFVRDQTTIGLGIYQRIFDLAPELKLVFQVPDDVNDLDGYQPFHRSGKLFVSVIDLCVRSIHMLEADMGPILVMYGRRHFHRQAQGFRIQYLPLFQSCILDHILENLPEEERTEICEDGWKALMKYIMGKLAEGFELERQRNASLRRKSVL